MNNKYYPNKNWEKNYISNLENNRELINRTIIEEYENINGIIILKNGYIVFEEYFNEKNIEDRFNVASVTKSILSSLIGIAIDKKYINSEEEKVISFYSDYELSKNRIRESVKIKELLSMTAPFPFKNMGQKLGKLIHSEDWIKYSLESLGLGGANSEFKYSDAAAHLLSGILIKTTNLTAREFANENLCKKIGMTEIPKVEMNSFELRDFLFTDLKGWLEDKNGLTIGGWGLTLTLRDMARFGLLYERKGKWNDEQIVSREWVEKSIKNYSKNYGYMWWLKNIKDYNIYYAMGTGGNMIVCIPEINTTIAIASEVTRDPIGDRWSLIEKFLLKIVE